jgi:hypothetical protein
MTFSSASKFLSRLGCNSPARSNGPNPGKTMQNAPGRNIGALRSCLYRLAPGGANNDRICKCRSHSQFSFAPVANVKRARCGIGSDPRNMDDPLDARPLGLAREPSGRFHMQGMKCLCSAFDIKADGIYQAISSSDSGCNRVFAAHIGAYRLQRGSFGGTRNPHRMPRGDPNRKALTKKMAHDAPSERSRSSKHRYNPIGHCRRATSQAYRSSPVPPGLACSFEELSRSASRPRV